MIEIIFLVASILLFLHGCYYVLFVRKDRAIEEYKEALREVRRGKEDE